MLAVQRPSRIDLAVSVIQQGRYPEMLGSNRSLYPFETLETAKDFFPPLIIFHGVDDTAVEVEGTQRLVRKFGYAEGERVSSRFLANFFELHTSR